MSHSNPTPGLPAGPCCGTCGAPLGGGMLGGLCPRCLFGLAESEGLEAGEAVLDAAVRSFGDYELLEEISRGGMGVVYRARQISLNRVVALKFILSGEMAGKAAREMFRNEALVAAGLHHAHIVTVLRVRGA